MQTVQATLITWANKAWDALVRLIFAISDRVPLVMDALKRQFARIPLTGFQWIALAFTVFALIYAVATPLFEAGEEIEHFAFIQAVRNGGLPITSAETQYLWDDQANQPPLYDATAALLTLPIDTSDFLNYLTFNPYAAPDDLYSLGNKNLLLQDAVAPSLTGTFLAVMVLRVANIALSLITLWVVSRISTAINPKRPSVALLAVALTAFNPMFLFLAASVGNLPLAMALNGVIVLLLMQIVREGLGLQRLILLAVMLALAVITHLSGLVLMVVALVTIGLLAGQTRAWRNSAIGAALIVAAVIVVAGWWFVRNAQLHGDPLNLRIWQALAGQRSTPLTFESLFGEFSYFRQTYWGVFGIDNIRMADALYILLDMFVITAVGGVIYLVGQLIAIRDFAHARRELIGVGLLLGVVFAALIVYLGWLIGVQRVPGAQMFPYIAAISPLLACGFIEMIWWLLFFVTPPDRSYVRAGDAVPNETLHPNAVWTARILGVMALLVPLVTIVPQYTPPAPIAELSPVVEQIYARFDNVELVGYDMLMERYLPGQVVGVTLYWRVVAPTEDDYSVTLAMLPPTGYDLGKIRTFPGWGKLRTSTWQAGATYADTYFIRLDPLIAGNFPLRLHVIWQNDTTGEIASITDEAGKPISNVLLDAGAMVYTRAFNSQLASLSKIAPGLREFDSKLRLEEFAFDRANYHTLLVWNAMVPMEDDYTMSVQILDANNIIAAQADAQPALPTRFWQYGDRYFTEHAVTGATLPLAPGDYRVIVAVYQLETMTRLAVKSNPDAEDPEPTDYTQLFTFTIAADGSFVSTDLDALQPEVTAEATPEATAEATPEATAEVTLTP